MPGVTLQLNKEDYVHPGDLLFTIKALSKARSHADHKGIPVGDLDVAIKRLREYHGLLCELYTTEISSIDETGKFKRPEVVK